MTRPTSLQTPYRPASGRPGIPRFDSAHRGSAPCRVGPGRCRSEGTGVRILSCPAATVTAPGRIAQLARALPSHGRGPQFKSVYAHHRNCDETPASAGVSSLSATWRDGSGAAPPLTARRGPRCGSVDRSRGPRSLGAAAPAPPSPANASTPPSAASASLGRPARVVLRAHRHAIRRVGGAGASPGSRRRSPSGVRRYLTPSQWGTTMARLTCCVGSRFAKATRGK